MVGTLATDEPTVVAKQFPDAVVVKDVQSDGCFPGPTRADENNECEAVEEVDDLRLSRKEVQSEGIRAPPRSNHPASIVTEA